MILHWGNLRAITLILRAGRGGCSLRLGCRGRRNIQDSLFLSSFVDMYSCGFAIRDV